MKKQSIFLLLFGIIIPIFSFAQHDDVYYGNTIKKDSTNKHPNLNFGFETALSYILFFDGNTSSSKTSKNIYPGGGISLLSEIKKGKHFSVLLGISLQYIRINNFECNCPEGDPDETTIDNGYQLRFEIPVWFRLTYGHKFPVFFQFGTAIGGNFYKGWGTQIINEGVLRYTVVNGWTEVNMPFVNMLALGIGFRKKIAPGVEIVNYIEGSPVSLQLGHTAPYSSTPITSYFQYNLAFNFSKK